MPFFVASSQEIEVVLTGTLDYAQQEVIRLAVVERKNIFLPVLLAVAQVHGAEKHQERLARSEALRSVSSSHRMRSSSDKRSDNPQVCEHGRAAEQVSRVLRRTWEG